MVYVTQEPKGINILPAQKFGEIKILIPGDRQLAFSAGAVAQKLMVEMSGFCDDDCLLLIGDPAIIGVASAVASHWNNGKVKLLKWDKQEKEYYPVQFNLFSQKGELTDG